MDLRPLMAIKYRHVLRMRLRSAHDNRGENQLARAREGQTDALHSWPSKPRQAMLSKTVATDATLSRQGHIAGFRLLVLDWLSQFAGLRVLRARWLQTDARSPRLVAAASRSHSGRLLGLSFLRRTLVRESGTSFHRHPARQLARPGSQRPRDATARRIRAVEQRAESCRRA